MATKKTSILDPMKPPRHLSDESRRIWRELNAGWILEGDQLLTLRTALEAFDRLQQARRILDIEGLTCVSRTAAGEVKVCRHPASSIEKEARNGFLAALKMLGLTMDEVTNPPGRPSAGKGWKR